MKNSHAFSFMAGASTMGTAFWFMSLVEPNLWLAAGVPFLMFWVGSALCEAAFGKDATE